MHLPSFRIHFTEYRIQLQEHLSDANTSIDRNIGTHYGNRYVFYRTMRENQGEEAMTLRDNRWKRKIAENGRNKE